VHTASRGRRKILLGCALVPLVFLLAIGGVWYTAHRQAKAHLAAQVAKVRARNEPLTTVELNDYYDPAPGRPDMTAELIPMLVLCESAGPKQLVDRLPIVGQGADPPPPPQEWEQLGDAETFLQPLQQAIALFHKVAQENGTVRFPVDFTAGFNTLLTNTQSLRSGARVLSLQFHVHMHRGETTQAADCVLAQLALSNVLDREPTLISQLVRLALVALAEANARSLVQHTDVSASDLERMQQAFRKIDLRDGLQRALAGERTFGYMACIDRFGGAAVTAPITPAEARRKAAQEPARTDDVSMILEQNLRITTASDESLRTALQESKKVETELKDLGQGIIAKFTYMMTLMISPAYRQGVNAFMRGAARRDCIDTAIAAELYRRKQGAWPAALEQLVPEFLPAVPIDAYTDQPLKIIVKPSEFTVYSVGPDEQDNGGKFSDRLEDGTDLGVSLSTPSP
jgi:hypothetical protein